MHVQSFPSIGVDPFRPAFAFLLAASGLSGCVATSTRQAASVVDYLYPEQNVVVTPAIPELALPLRVGIAFVPETSASWAVNPATALPEAERMALLDDIAEHFRRQPFVRTIEVIPSAYLVPRGGFTNVDQIQRMFDVDVVTLVSYDQVQFTDARRRSLTYWTLVGAYVVEGERNDTRTMLDAAVFDVRSRKMLFRAPGTSTVKGSAAPVALSAEQRRDRERGFTLAADELKANLARELERFQERVHASPEEYRVTERPEAVLGGQSGAGSLDLWMLLAAAGLAGSAACLRRRR
jgi:rhombotail lipoprotein